MCVSQVLTYIYTGRLDSADVEVIKGIFLASNMLQMSDLEHIAVWKSVNYSIITSLNI